MVFFPCFIEVSEVKKFVLRFYRTVLNVKYCLYTTCATWKAIVYILNGGFLEMSKLDGTSCSMHKKRLGKKSKKHEKTVNFQSFKTLKICSSNKTYLYQNI